MIIKGKGRTDAGQLSAYLGDYLTSGKNERVEVIQIRGSLSYNLNDALSGWDAEAKGGKCKLPLWHAQLRTPDGEHLTRQQQLEAVDILEKHLGFQGQPRAIVIHGNAEGHEHIHVAWSRIRRTEETVTLKNGKQHTYKVGSAKRDDFTHKKNVAAAREIEERFGLQKVESPEFGKEATRQERREASKQKFSYKDFQKAKRSGLDPKRRVDTITALWKESDSGKAFRASLQDAGYVLAHGDRRAFVIVDEAGDIHSLSRQIRGAKVADVKARLADIDPASIPLARHVQTDHYRAFEEQHPQPKSAKKKAEQRGVVIAPDRSKPDSRSLEPETILAAMTQQKSTFTKGELAYEIGKRVEARDGDINPERVAAIARKVGKHNDFITLGTDPVGRTRYTSRDMLETELSMRGNADVLASRQLHGIWHKIRDEAPSAQKLSEDQRKAFEAVTSPSALSNMIGPAGSGKSFTLGAVREAYEANGLRVKGYTISGMAAQSLQNGSNIESRTIASLFREMEKLPERKARLANMDAEIEAITGKSFEARKLRCDRKTVRDQYQARMDATAFTSRDVIVIDEAGMVGSRDMNRLLSAAQQAKAKVILVGDAEQLQAIDAGGAFRALCDRHGAVRLNDIRRQKHEWAKEATKDFSNGFTADALKAYQDGGHVHAMSGHEEARQRMVADWKQSRQASPNDTHLMLAYTRKDVVDLNKQARETYRAEQRLGLDTMVQTADGQKAFARGDRFYFLENNSQLGVKNGTLGTVESITANSVKDYHRIRVKLDPTDSQPTCKTVEFTTADYSKFSHGYAATVHKSQGITADRSLVLASQFMDRHAAYVAMSRHKERADMYYSTAEFGKFDDLVKKLSRDRRKDTTLDYIGRAEKAGVVEQYLNVIRKTVVILTDAEKRKRAIERMAEAIQLSRNPAAKAQKKEVKKAKRKLQEILGKYPGKKKERNIGIAI